MMKELFEIGYVGITADRDTNRVQCGNAIDACAAFIKQEIESIRSGRRVINIPIRINLLSMPG